MNAPEESDPNMVVFSDPELREDFTVRGLLASRWGRRRPTAPPPRRPWWKRKRTWAATAFVVAWLPYGFFTYWWYALGMDDGYRGEAYGPVSYFRPRAFWLGIAGTVSAVALWLSRRHAASD